LWPSTKLHRSNTLRLTVAFLRCFCPFCSFRQTCTHFDFFTSFWSFLLLTNFCLLYFWQFHASLFLFKTLCQFSLFHKLLPILLFHNLMSNLHISTNLCPPLVFHIFSPVFYFFTDLCPFFLFHKVRPPFILLQMYVHLLFFQKFMLISTFHKLLSVFSFSQMSLYFQFVTNWCPVLSTDPCPFFIFLQTSAHFLLLI
jgi:hypothetical protein